MPNKKKFILIDSNALVHRAFHAYPQELQTLAGEQVNAAYGFTIMLLKVIKDFKPDCLVCVFDSEKPTFRHKQYIDYKAHRKPLDENLSSQFPRVQQIVKAFDIPLYQVEGYEADDAIGSIAKNVSKDFDVVIVTGDHDILQLIDEHISVFMAGRNFKESKLYTSKEVKDRYKINPIQIIEYKALKGDTSDNIPGVKGIGEKTAIDLILKYGDITNLYDHIDELKGSLFNKLNNDKENAFLSREIATIVTNLKLDLKLNDCEWNGGDLSAIKKLFHELQFKSLITQLESLEIYKDSKSEHEQDNHEEMTFDVLTDDKKILKLLKNINKNSPFFFYGDVIGVSPVDYQINAIILYCEGQYAYIPNFNIDSELGRLLRSIFENNSIQKITHGSKVFMHGLKNRGIELRGKVFDICIAYHLLNLGVKVDKLSDITFALYSDVLQVPEYNADLLGSNSMQKYLAKSVHYIALIYTELVRQFEEAQKLKNLFIDVEMPLSKVLFDMEQNGISVDVNQIKELKKELTTKIDTLKKEIFNDVGHEFNINSSKQVGEILFNELKLPSLKKTKTGGFSTNEKILKKLAGAHPIIEKLLLYREYAKVRSTYTDTLISEVNQKTVKIHTTYKQTYAVTGRLSSVKPNLQNIPIASQWGEPIRKAFVAKKDQILVSFDVSQQELRLLAHFSNEAKLIEAFTNNIDVHAVTASEILGIKLDEVSKAQRGVGKVLNYSIIYGMSGFALADMLEIPRAEAQKLIDTYFEKYAAVRVFLDEFLEKAKSSKYVETLLGRRKSTAGLSSTNFQMRSAAVREILNFPLQGTAADLMKLAMVKVEKMKSKNFDSKLLLQIHDELLYECDATNKVGLKDFIKQTQYEMEHVYQLKVPLLVEVKSGKSWADT